jgi:nucleoid DNA-binding protein
MKKLDLANDVAKRQGVKTGAAADQLDRAVTRIIRALRRGQRAHLPGLGTITPGKPWTFRQVTSEERNEH